VIHQRKTNGGRGLEQKAHGAEEWKMEMLNGSENSMPGVETGEKVTKSKDLRD
jgi:hypothetical protein